MRRFRGMTAVAVALLVLTGCDRGPKMYPVSGTVTLDGNPVPEGEILFTDGDGKLGPDAGKIKDGRFEFQAKAGKKRVEISASKVLPGSKVRGAGGEPVPEEYIPEWYNVNSTLTEEVKPGGDNRYEFKLSGKKK